MTNWHVRRELEFQKLGAYYTHKTIKELEDRIQELERKVEEQTELLLKFSPACVSNK